MARKEINIGIEGNDGTGDSIRDSFSKVNDNFGELYAVLGLGGALSFIGLDDVAQNSYRTEDNNKILTVDSNNEKIQFTKLDSNETIVIDQSTPGVIKFSSLASALINDPDPTLAADMDANQKRITSLADAQLDDDAATKGYVDTKLSIAGVDAIDENGNIEPDWGTMTGPLILSRNPIDSDDVNYGGLVASTKAYVDSKTFISANNLYVATNGQDERDDIPLSQQGRSPSTAFKTIAKAAEVAEEIVLAAPVELGPYQKTLTYDNGTKDCTLVNLIQSPLSGNGATGTVEMQLDENQVIEIINGGTDYEIGTELTLTGGTVVQPAVLRVTAKDFAGSITQVTIVDPGIYSVLPTDIANVQHVSAVSGSGTARFSVKFSVNRVLVTASGSNYGSASVIFNGGGAGSGAEASTTEIAGEIKEVNIVRKGSGYTAIPTIQIFLPRMLLETDNLGTDFTDDLREGQLLRGVTSDAVAKIISHSAERDANGDEIFEVELLQGAFQIGEVIQYGDPAQNVQITIQVETGIYYEQFPIRLSPNVSLRGDEFRRSIIRPKQGVSESKWSRVFFRRDPVIDGLRVTEYEFGYQYLTDPLDFSSKPKNNDQMDVFLCADATIVRNVSVQGHGGFMMVLDPNNQINSKSPYCQTGSSFAKSINAKIFAGGQFVDGFMGNLDGILLYKSGETGALTRNPVGGDDSKIVIGGLQREPQLPTSFNIGEDIYRITLTNRIESAYFDAKVLIEQNRSFIQEETIQWLATQNLGFAFDETKCRRDVGLIVDGVVSDILYGGYEESTRAGRLYFSGGLTVVAGQVAATAAAVSKARDIATTCVQQNTWPALGNIAQTKIASITGAETGGAQQEVQNCFDIVANIISYGEKMYIAKKLLQENKEFIQADTIGYLAVNYPNLDYNVATCFRDTGYIVDALSIDLFGNAPNAGVSDLNQGNFNNSIRAGYSYYRAGKKLIPSSGDPQTVNQLPATLDAVEHIKTRVGEILNNTTPASIFVGQTINPTVDLDITSNEFTIINHGFNTGSRVTYSNGGGDSLDLADGGTLTNNGVYFTYKLDDNRFKLYRSLELVRAQERDPGSEFEIDFSGLGTGTSHSLQWDVTKDITLTAQDLVDAGISEAINTSVGYMKTLIAGDDAAAGETYASFGDSTGVPVLYPLYECVLDNPYDKMTAGKITLATPGNKSMLGNDFTQVNDMGYGVFATNNGLVESVSMFTYYCYNAYFALNGAQIRSLNGSSAHGVYGLRSSGADPNEVPDRVGLKFPLIQTGTVFEDRPVDVVNDKTIAKIYVANVSYPPFPGCFVDVDHSDDPQRAGGVSALGFRSYKITAISTSGLPNGTYELSIDTNISDGGLAADVPAGKPVIIRAFEEFTITDKVQVVSTRPSTALVFDESVGINDAVIRVLSFNGFNGVDAQDGDQNITTKDGFPYVDLNVRKSDSSFTPPSYANGLGDDAIVVQTLPPEQSARLTKQTTGYAIYDGSSTATGGMIFGYQDSIYEVTDYKDVDILDGGNNKIGSYGVVSFRNITDTNETLVNRSYTITGATASSTITVTVSSTLDLREGRQIRITGADNATFDGLYYAGNVTTNTFDLYSDKALTTLVDGSSFGAAATSGTVELFGGATSAFEDSNENLQIKAGLRAGALGEVTVNISTMRATGHDFLDIGTGSYADTNYPSNIFGPPNNNPLQSNEAVEEGTGRVFWVSSDQSGNFRVGEFFAVDQGTGKVTLDAKIDLQGITSLRLAAGETVSEFTGDVTLGGAGEASNQALPTEAAVRGYIDRRLGLTHEGGIQTVLIGPGYLPRDGSRQMTGPIDMSNNFVRGLPDPDVGIEGEGDAIRKAYMKIGNLQDAPEGWMYEENPADPNNNRQPDYSYIESADILAFTNNGSSEFSNATVVGALTFTFQQNAPGVADSISPTVTNYPDPQIVATINDNVIVNADINYDAGIEQHKLDLNTARTTEFEGIGITSYVYTAESAPGAGDDYTTITTSEDHGMSEGDAVVISEETVVTALNGDWKATNITANAFRIPADTSTGGVVTGGKIRHYGIISGAQELEFTLVNGFLELKDSTNATRVGAYYDGIGFEKLRYIDVATVHVTDNTNLAVGSNTKVLARRSNPGGIGQAIDGPPVPIDAKTIVEDGLGCRRPDFGDIGVMARIGTGNTAADFATIEFTSSNTANTIVQRSGTGSADFAGTSSFENINSDGNITINVSDGVESGNQSDLEGLWMTYAASTTPVITKHEQSAANNAYYVNYRNGNGDVAIKAQFSNVAADHFTEYRAGVHKFRTAGGSAGRVEVGAGGTLTAENGVPSATAYVEGDWRLIAGSRLTATWADLAEYYEGDKTYEVGTVVQFGGDKEVTESGDLGTHKVAGVVSNTAAYVMNSECPGEKVLVALQGRVPCKVIGKIEKGDLMIASGIPGVATSAGDDAKPGTIIGKAIEVYDSDRIGTIEVAVGRL